MKEYTYHFNNDTTETVEVKDEMYETLKKLDSEERNNNQTETRRKISTDALNDKGIELVAPDDKVENMQKKKRAIMKVFLKLSIIQLPPRQRKLVYLLYWKGKTVKEIAEIEGVDHTTISHRKQRVLKKIKKIFEKTSTFCNFRDL